MIKTVESVEDLEELMQSLNEDGLDSTVAVLPSDQYGSLVLVYGEEYSGGGEWMTCRYTYGGYEGREQLLNEDGYPGDPLLADLRGAPFTVFYKSVGPGEVEPESHDSETGDKR